MINSSRPLYRIIAQVLIVIMIFQGYPLAVMARANVDDGDSYGAAYRKSKPKPAEFADSDYDGMSDDWESAQELDPTVFNGVSDSDEDGFTNYQEYMAATNPLNPNDTPAFQTFHVPEDYSSIQEAIDAAKPSGGVIEVGEGVYNERIKIYDNIRVIGCGDPGLTVIDGGGKQTVVDMPGTNSGISGFTIRNSGKNGNFAGITCLGNEKTEIANCIIINNGHGIRYGGSATPYIANNTILKC